MSFKKMLQSLVLKFPKAKIIDTNKIKVKY